MILHTSGFAIIIMLGLHLPDQYLIPSNKWPFLDQNVLHVSPVKVPLNVTSFQKTAGVTEVNTNVILKQ